MDVVAVVSLVIGVIALVLAAEALSRTAPTLTYKNTGPDYYTFWNEGPGDAVIIEATVLTPEGSEGLFERSMHDERLLQADHPYAKGVVLPPHRKYDVHVGVNTDLEIEYRAGGLLGRWSKATLRIEGAM